MVFNFVDFVDLAMKIISLFLSSDQLEEKGLEEPSELRYLLLQNQSRFPPIFSFDIIFGFAVRS